MNLDDLLNEIREKMKNRDLSDDYLKEHGNSTRGEIGIGEYSYGITMIPCEWVYKYLSDYKRLQEEFKQVDHECERLEQKEVRLEKENEELKEERDAIYSDYQYLGKEKWEADEAILFLTERLENSISKQKIKDKIEELNKKIASEENEKVILWLHKQRNVLQDLLESEG